MSHATAAAIGAVIGAGIFVVWVIVQEFRSLWAAIVRLRGRVTDIERGPVDEATEV